MKTFFIVFMYLFALCWSDSRTLEERMTSRCIQFQNEVRNLWVNCGNAVSEFKRVLQEDKDECKIKPEDFNGFISTTMKYMGKKRTLFWTSHLTTQIVRYSKYLNAYSMESGTLPGFILNGENDWSSLGNKCASSRNSFWLAASVKFAKLAGRNSLVLVNSETGIINSSVLVRHELPNMQSVRHLKIIIVEPNGNEGINCDDKTVKRFTKMASDKGIHSVCTGPFKESELIGKGDMVGSSSDNKAIVPLMIVILSLNLVIQ